VAHHSPQRTGAFVTKRLEEIRRERRSAEAAARAAEEAKAAEPSALDRAAEYLATEPQRTLTAPSRLGAFGRFMRRVLYRLLRPHTVPQRIFETEVVHALRDTEAVLAQHQAAMDGYATEQRSMQQVDAQVSDALQRHLERLERVEKRAEMADAALETHLGSFTEDMSRHLQALEQRVADAEARASFLWESVHTAPYVSDRSVLETTDDAGKRVLGYSDGSDRASDDDLYRRFEDVFRGSEAFIRDRQRAYVELLRGHEPILDIGCGRGELLDLLADENMSAKGVDVDPGMVERCREKGHDVELADGLEFLAAAADGSLGSIFTAQVVEHLPYEALVRFFELARAKLGHSGVLVVETVNPHSLGALKNFWLDPTHTAPVFPEVALLLSRLHGFPAATIVFPNGSGDLERDLREQGEYAMVALGARPTE
jgi:2-polyprenyl-3-methyl-5-hydroxy-6-metoxy-1,4-benzoquinol methylase